jgi:hypothetical protein
VPRASAPAGRAAATKKKTPKTNEVKVRLARLPARFVFDPFMPNPVGVPKHRIRKSFDDAAIARPCALQPDLVPDANKVNMAASLYRSATEPVPRKWRQYG